VPFATAALAVALGAALLDWLAVARDALALERIAKPAVIVALIGVALAAGGPFDLGRWLLLAALVASLAGDALLLPPGRFVPGLVAFLVAQLAYLGRFLLRPASIAGLAVGLIAAGGLLARAGRPILGGAARAGLRLPVAIYLTAICAMAVAATATGAAATGSLATIAGAWLFVASDTALGWDRFVAPPATPGRETTLRRLAVIVPYHLGQVLLVASLTG